jgi:methyl-accepting chemotaxis protein
MGALSRLSIAGKLGVAAGLAIGVLLLVAAAAVSMHTRGVVSDLNRRYADVVAAQATQEVAAELNAAAAATKSMAGMIGAAREAGVNDRASYVAMIRPEATVYGPVMGAWFMAEPNKVGGDDSGHIGEAATASNVNGRLSVYWVNHGGQVGLEPTTDGSDFGEAYYKGPAASGRPTLTEPYVETISGASVQMASVAYPVTAHGDLIGVAGLDMSLANLSARLAARHPLGGGRVMLLSATGKWIAHPDAGLLMKPYGDPGAEAMAAAMGGTASARPTELKINGKAFERLFRPVAFPELNTTWVLVVDVPRAAITGSADRLAVVLLVGGLAITGAVLVLLFALSGALVARPLGSLTAAVQRLSQGLYDRAAPGVERGDEVGAIASALEGFRRDLADGERRRTEQERERSEAEAERNAHAEETLSGARAQAAAVETVGEGMASLAQGDLTWRMDHGRFTEATRRIPTDFNGAVTALSATISGIQNAAQEIRRGCAEISRASDDLSLRTERQAAGLEQTAAALDELTVTVNKSAEGAARARKATEVARQAAQRSGQVVGEAVEAMGGIEASSQEITQIIGVIDEIAFQTNLLALNAGVEAARAGDAGKGFAVVASEVRALAQRSAEAAKQIKQLIQGSTGQVDRGVNLVGQTGSALREILTQVEEINELVGEIAASSREQASGLAEINVAVNQMDQVTQQNAAMVEETTAASRTLAEEANELERLVAGFKVDGTRAGRAPAAAPLRRVAHGGGRAASSPPASDSWEEF